MTKIDARGARRALARLPEGASYGETPTLGDVYLPRSHLKAMDVNVQVVTGMRGAGKTFWWGALQRPGVRRLIAESTARAALDANTVVKVGFGARHAPGDYPDADTLRELMARHEPLTIWRTILARQLADGGNEATWRDRAARVAARTEETAQLFYAKDMRLERLGKNFLVLFDALDVCAHEWQDMYGAIRDLLRAAAEMRSWRRLRVKIFLRSDQFDKARVADFPDASKVLFSAMELSWPRRELYGLLWHCLANGAYGDEFRTYLGGDWEEIGSGADTSFHVPRELAKEERQRRLFHDIAGPFMGTDRRRGFPYSWIPTHLADSERRVGPRSFLAALREAARDTDARYPDHERALHYDSIEAGVRKASIIRVDEIREDYPWIHRVLEPLRGTSVPLAFDEIEDRWKEKQALESLNRDLDTGEIGLPPRHIRDGARGVREDLESIGVFQRLVDGRVNMPDIFRVGFGIGRKGGVKPAR